ncbi:dihydrolipoamide acetyltransferase family protein [Mycolicibacterium bacteremicum]|uniref:Dihydrolipoamide acetyltransferase component of pyruvate dehydrogenase complex n=1 Tax=Mycolicibacterium bacteremicum TaxID=564198 RepID=A0A1W9YYP1_MYCBA|nr:dihydrolipoamide acetyltransferase family protein [Mycolicibacterium bacteremicum]MCV7431436.1 2-oxo acid dehydrogenase subunit E2 [Mycolicibacterium bacteremicum]ORA05193.1 branched-chain alpha-keto acid dehydrogenase subunit E2 [Mycolicibacterium bacteremicum]
MSGYEFRVPDLGEGLEEATITGWAVAVGDTVELNQVLCTLETNKAEVEIPSPHAGQIAELGGAVGDTLAVGALLVRIGADESAGPGPVLVGYGADDRLDGSRRVRAKPSTRKLARTNGVDLTSLKPAGPDGIVTRDDVLAAAATPDMMALSGVQTEMAKRMVLSRSRIADAHASVQVDGTALQQLSHRLQITPFVLALRLLALVLGRHPMLNATWVDTADGPRIHRHASVHLGVGVATPRGLLVPVVTDAQQRSTRALAAEVTRLIDGARGGTLRPGELMGSTFTVSNFGALGLDSGVPVINYPEAAILGMGSLKPRPVVIDGAVLARPTMELTCVFDHRIADGAQAAAFLTDLRDLIEAPEMALADL